MDMMRLFKHLLVPGWIPHRAFSRDALDRIGRAIGESERAHRGELRFAVEAGLGLVPLIKGVGPRQRARQLFSDLGVWDTAGNSGVLIYLQLVDHDIEIVADRGFNGRVEQAQWDAICHRMEEAFRAGRFEEGVLAGIAEITALLKAHFPAGTDNVDELPDRPVVL
jgi:uncharacterized membrane protein